jgi:uncharacterized protein
LVLNREKSTQVFLLVAASTRYFHAVSKKSNAIAALIEGCRGRELNANYLAYFECFNRQLFFEAHEVLEKLWLPQRTGPNGSFHKGLIQLAGAFVHLQKNRLRPAAALFKLAETNLQKYPPTHERLDVAKVLELIQTWQQRLESGRFEVNPLSLENQPEVKLLS